MVRSERFEMRLDSALLEQIDKWRDRRSDQPSRAEAVRQLLEHALAGSLREETQFDRPQRLMIWMLSEILMAQKGYENKEDIELIQEAIYGGHFWALDWELTGVLHSHTDKREALSLVVDTLDMWVFIERAYSGFSKTERDRLEKNLPYLGNDPQFTGFDGNNEGEYMGIARFLIEKMGRFEHFKGRSMNSHMPVVERYADMLRIFEPIREKLVGRELSVDEMIAVLSRS